MQQAAAAAAAATRRRRLSAEQFRTLERLTDLIIPVDNGKPGAMQAQVPAWIDALLNVNAELQGAATSRGWPGSMRPTTTRHGTASRAHAGAADRAARHDRLQEEPHAGADPGIDFFILARRMTVDGFYTSPIGMRDIYPGNTAPQRVHGAAGGDGLRDQPQPVQAVTNGARCGTVAGQGAGTRQERQYAMALAMPAIAVVSSPDGREVERGLKRHAVLAHVREDGGNRGVALAKFRSRSAIVEVHVGDPPGVLLEEGQRRAMLALGPLREIEVGGGEPPMTEGRLEGRLVCALIAVKRQPHLVPVGKRAEPPRAARD